MFRDYFAWGWEVCTKPTRSTKKDYKYGEFVKRLVVLSLVSGFLTTVVTFYTFDKLLATEGDAVAWASVFAPIPVYILSAVFAPFVNGAVTHFFGKIVFKLMRKDYKKTYNASAYSMAPRFLFAWIPFIGIPIAAVWGLIVYVYALANQQKISKGRALLVVLIPVFIALAIGLIVAAMAASFVLGAMFGPEMMDAMIGKYA